MGTAAEQPSQAGVAGRGRAGSRWAATAGLGAAAQGPRWPQEWGVGAAARDKCVCGGGVASHRGNQGKVLGKLVA